MLIPGLIHQLKTTESFFLKTTECFEEKDSNYAPNDDMWSIAHQIAHTAQTVDWFFEGAFNKDGFNLDFEAHEKEIKEINSLEKSLQWFKTSIAKGIETLESRQEEEMRIALPEGPVMGGVPRYVIVGAIADHCAHHRGSLATYARCLGKTPPMPYGDPPPES